MKTIQIITSNLHFSSFPFSHFQLTMWNNAVYHNMHCIAVYRDAYCIVRSLHKPSPSLTHKILYLYFIRFAEKCCHGTKTNYRKVNLQIKAVQRLVFYMNRRWRVPLEGGSASREHLKPKTLTLFLVLKKKSSCSVTSDRREGNRKWTDWRTAEPLDCKKTREKKGFS